MNATSLPTSLVASSRLSPRVDSLAIRVLAAVPLGLPHIPSREGYGSPGQSIPRPRCGFGPDILR